MATSNPSATLAHPVTDRLSAVRALSHACFVLGFVSIAVSILVWVAFKSPDPAHGERFGIFIGLWAPTFFALSDRLDRYVTGRNG